MLVHHSYDNRFVSTLERLRKELGEEMFELSGIGSKQLDINNFAKTFFGSSSNTADASIDANANVNDKSVTGWMTEYSKPIMKLNAYYQLWGSALKKHGIKRANKLVEYEIRGSIRIHDLWLWSKPYCWAASLNQLVEQGMPFHPHPKTGPTKHIDSFINVSLQYLCYLSNQIAGAVALPDFFAYAEYFIRADYGEDWKENEKSVNKIKQLFQNWIFSVNFSWRSNQSPFTNLSIMDEKWLHALFDNHLNPDHSSPNFDNLMFVQKLFVDCVIENRKDNPFTFPVLTACLLYNEETNAFEDDVFAEWVAEVNADTGIFNIFSDDNINALSSCCFSGDEVIEVQNNDTDINEIMTIKTFIDMFTSDINDQGESIDKSKYSIVSYNIDENIEEVVPITGILKKKNSKELIKFYLEDNSFVSVTPDHVFKVRSVESGEFVELTAEELSENAELYEIPTK